MLELGFTRWIERPSVYESNGCYYLSLEGRSAKITDEQFEILQSGRCYVSYEYNRLVNGTFKLNEIKPDEF